MRRLVVVLGVMAAVLLFFRAAEGSVQAGWELPTTPPVGQGISFTDAGLTMTVTRSSHVTTIGDYPTSIWIVVKVLLTNRSGTPKLFDPVFQQLFIDDREYVPTPEAAEMIEDGVGSAASLPPGEGSSVIVAFSAPGERTDRFDEYVFRLVLRGDVNSPGSVVVLRLGAPAPAPTKRFQI